MISKLNNQIIEEMKSTKVWSYECQISLDRLSLVRFSYYDFEGSVKDDGELVVLDVCAKYVDKIMAELFKIKFPINSAIRIEKFNGDDNISMFNNNSSSFNFRFIDGTKTVSIHGYGLAIDINPVQNPCVVFTESDLQNENFALSKIYPKQGKNFLNRGKNNPGMTEQIVDIFYENGFTIWGGNWDFPIDYHHFQVPRWLAELLASVDKVNGEILFDCYLKKKKIDSKEELISFCEEV